MTIGDRIRVNSHHWSRANAMGTIESFDAESKANNRYTIEFENDDGSGFRLEGCGEKKHLTLSEDQFTKADKIVAKIQAKSSWNRLDHAK